MNNRDILLLHFTHKLPHTLGLPNNHATGSDPSVAQPVLFIDFGPFVEPASVPEPASIAICTLLGLVLCGSGYRRWQNAK